MGNFTDVLPVWEVFKTQFEGAEIAFKIHKLTLGEVLTYLCIKNNLTLAAALKLPEAELVSELAGILTRGEAPSALTAEIQREVIKRGEEINFPPEEKSKKKASPEWVAALCARLGCLGYKRADVLALYPAEIPALLREAERESIRQAMRIAIAVNAPAALADELKAFDAPEERNEVSMNKYRELEKKYLGKNNNVGKGGESCRP